MSKPLTCCVSVYDYSMFTLHACALRLAAQCIVIGPVRVFACLQRAGGYGMVY